MKLYVAICCDRHYDPELRVFSTPDKAIAYARRFIVVSAAHPERIEEDPTDGYLFWARFSVEGGDWVGVEEVTLDDEE